MNCQADYCQIHPVENEENIVKAWSRDLITKETAVHKLMNLPSMTFERLTEIFGGIERGKAI